MINKERKAAIRAERLALRDALSEEARVETAQAVAKAAGAKLDFEPGSVISGFFPIRSEVDVRPLMDVLEARGARLCLPVILDRETIVFREFVPGVELVAVGFGTRGPGPDAAVLEPDIMLMPLAAFDMRGHRIGYGAGHYDRAIAKMMAKGLKPRLIGVAFDCQEVPEVPFEPHDVGLDAILTESGLREFVK